MTISQSHTWPRNSPYFKFVDRKIWEPYWDVFMSNQRGTPIIKLGKFCNSFVAYSFSYLRPKSIEIEHHLTKLLRQ